MATASQGSVIAAYFADQSDAEDAVRDLQSAGFRADQIGSSYDDFDRDTLSPAEYSTTNAPGPDDHRSFWEKIKDFFSGESDEAAHGDRSAYQTGEDLRWGHNMAIPARYRDRLANGGGLVTVHTPDRLDEAERILVSNDGEIDREFASTAFGAGSSLESDTAFGAGQGTRADITGGNTFDESRLDPRPFTDDYAAGTGQGTRADITGGDVSPEAQGLTRDELRDPRLANLQNETPEGRIQLISEVLRVRKERVQRGEVRLRKDVKTETENIQVPVTREEIVIERTPASGERTANAAIGSDQEIRVPLSEERVQVDKVPIVREEVRVGKRQVSNTQNVSDQVRREELDVEGADEDLDRDPNRRIA